MATMMAEQKTNAGLKLEVSRVMKAERARVFEAWTKPEIVQRWFGPRVELDARAGGKYLIEASCGDHDVSDTSHKSSAVTGVYRKVVENELLEFTWVHPMAPNEETLVTVKFRDVEGGTEVVIRHELFTTEVGREQHESGWRTMLERVAKITEG